MDVSEHFDWTEVEHTDTGLANTIPDVYKANAIRQADTVLEPLRVLLGPLKVDSWYRSKAVNAAVGGESTSYHLEALATDVVPKGDVFAAFKMACTQINDLPIDQLIYEKHRSEWIHVGTNREGVAPRRMMLVSDLDANGKRFYKRYNP